MKSLALFLLFVFYQQGDCGRHRRSNPIMVNHTVGGNSGIDLKCNFYNTSIWIYNIFFTNLTHVYNPDRVMFVDNNSLPINNCSYVFNGDFHATLMDLDKCASSVANENKNLIVHYRVSVSRSSSEVYLRDSSVYIHLACNYTAITVNRLVLYPRIQKLFLNNSEEAGTIVTALSRCSNASCDQKISFNEPAYALAPVYAELFIDNPALPNIIIQATDCWLTQQMNSTTTPRFDIIQSGCVTANANDTVIYENYMSQKVRFSYQAFLWTPLSSKQIAFLHCTVRYCDSSIQSGCTTQPSCARRRRSVTGHGKMETISSGKMTIIPTPCDKDALGCSHSCEYSISYPHRFCSCPSGYYLAEDRKTCLQNRKKTIYGSGLAVDETVYVPSVSISVMWWVIYALVGLVCIATAYTEYNFFSRKKKLSSVSSGGKPISTI